MTPAQVRALCLQLADACLDVEIELDEARGVASHGYVRELETASARKASRRYRRLLLGLKLEAAEARNHVSKEWGRLVELGRKKATK